MNSLRFRLAGLLFACVLAAPLLMFSQTTARADAPCGEDNQPACSVTKAAFCGFVMPDGDIPVCWGTVKQCNNPYLKVDNNNFCHTAQRSAGLQCCTKVDYWDNGKHVTEGYYGTVDLSQAWIVIPNLAAPGTCLSNWQADKNVVRSIPDWSADSFYTTRLKINANFFDVTNGRNPYFNQCTKALGRTISNKEEVSPSSQVHGANTANLAFMTGPYSAQYDVWGAIVDDAVATYGRDNIQNLISGYTLLKSGQYVQQPAAITPELYRPRAAVGTSYNTKIMYVVVVNPGNDDATPDSGGITLPGLADYLKLLGASDALTLDGSGSAQLDYFDPQTGSRFRTKASDTVSLVSRVNSTAPCRSSWESSSWQCCDDGSGFGRK